MGKTYTGSFSVVYLDTSTPRHLDIFASPPQRRVLGGGSAAANGRRRRRGRRHGRPLALAAPPCSPRRAFATVALRSNVRRLSTGCLGSGCLSEAALCATTWRSCSTTLDVDVAKSTRHGRLHAPLQPRLARMERHVAEQSASIASHWFAAPAPATLQLRHRGGCLSRSAHPNRLSSCRFLFECAFASRRKL